MLSFLSQISIALVLLSPSAITKCLGDTKKVAHCNEEDRRVLSIFKQAVLPYPNEWLSSWSTKEDCCAWTGVHCDNVTGRVTRLVLIGDYYGTRSLTGEVPPSMGALSRLEGLDLQSNYFFGKFPHDLSNWIYLKYLNIQNNNFSGYIPKRLPQELAIIIFRSNHFTGNIPPEIFNLSSLIVLDLADNKLSGDLPHCPYNVSSMTSVVAQKVEFLFLYGSPIYWLSQSYKVGISIKGRELEYNKYLYRSIDISTNCLSREISQELFSLIPLQSLNLSYNNFVGKIPKKIGGMENLESLDLSYNKLSRKIPQTISNLSFLAVLNLSYNEFTGQIPLGTQIQGSDEWSFAGNPKLCGPPLPNCQKPEEFQKQKLDSGNEDGLFLKSLFLGMGVGFAVGFWGVCCSLFFIRGWRHKFFWFLDRLGDQLYVAVALRFKSFGCFGNKLHSG